MAEIDPQHASEYDDRTTAAVKSVLVEIGQILGSYRGKFAVIGGAVPWLLLNQSDMPHIGTLDVDLTLDAEALGDGEYAQLVESLLRHPIERFLPDNRSEPVADRYSPKSIPAPRGLRRSAHRRRRAPRSRPTSGSRR